LGTNLLTVSPGAATTGGIRSQAGSMTSLTYEDAQAIIDSPQITSIEAASAELSRNAQIVAGRANTNTRVIGVMPDYAQIRKIEIQTGNFISQRDLESQAKVVILGPQVVSDLFGEGANPVGQSLRINKLSFRIIGVTKAKGGTGFFNEDDIVYIPLTTAQKTSFAKIMLALSLWLLKAKN
jgi:putative ABC transport system permease protein